MLIKNQKQMVNADSVDTENISIILKAVLPKYDNLSDAPAESGSVVWISGAGADPEGAYRYDGDNWKGLGAGSLTDDDLDSIAGFDLGSHVDRHEATGADEITFGNLASVVGVSGIKMDIATNLSPSVADRICIETDTGRVLYDDSATFTEVGLSESQIALGNLASKSHSELSDAPSGAHHTKTTQRVDSSIPQLIEDTSGNIPTAGTEGRIFFESDTRKVKYDDGASWVIIGTTKGNLETGGSDQLRLTSQLMVLKEGVTWEIGANRIMQMVLPPGGQIEGTDTIQGDGDLLLFEL